MTAAKVLGDTADVDRFKSKDAYTSSQLAWSVE